MKFTIHSSRSRTNLITPSVFVFCFEGDLLIEVLFRLARGYHLHYLRIESKTTGKTCVHMFDGRRINGFKLVSNMSIFFPQQSIFVVWALFGWNNQPAPRGVRRQGTNYFALPKKEPGELLEGAIPWKWNTVWNISWLEHVGNETWFDTSK